MRSKKKKTENDGLQTDKLDNLYCDACMTFSSVQFSSVAQSCLTLRNPMDHSMPGFPVHHQLPGFTQTHPH